MGSIRPRNPDLHANLYLYLYLYLYSRQFEFGFGLEKQEQEQDQEGISGFVLVQIIDEINRLLIP